MAVNYLAPVFFTLGLKDRLKGHVVTIASSAALLRLKCVSSYIASKCAIYGFMNCFRMELAIQNCRITSTMICPYAVDTGMFDGFQTRLSKVFPMLKEAEVASIIVRAIVEREDVVFIPFWFGLVSKLLLLLPDAYIDKLSSWLDVSNYSNNPAVRNSEVS